MVSLTLIVLAPSLGDGDRARGLDAATGRADHARGLGRNRDRCASAPLTVFLLMVRVLSAAIVIAIVLETRPQLTVNPNTP